MEVKELKEQWREARREQILEAAGRVFAEKGFRSAKMKQVAEAAGVSNGTVYNYFPSKDKLLQAVLHRLNETEKREAQFAGGMELGSFGEFLGAMLGHRLSFMRQNLEVFRAVLPELLRKGELQSIYRQEVMEPGFAMSQELFQAMQAAGEVRPELDGALLSRLLASQVLGLLVLEMLGDGLLEEREEELVEALSAVLCGGLLSNKEERA